MTHDIPAAPPDKGRMAKFAALFAVVALCLGYLLTVGLAKSVVPYMTVPEFAAAGHPDSRVRLTGYVVDGSIERSADGLSVRFAVGEAKEVPPGIPVRYHGPIPDTFKDGSEVVVEGAWQGEAFRADILLAKCPSRYEAALEAGMTHPEAAEEGEGYGGEDATNTYAE